MCVIPKAGGGGGCAKVKALGSALSGCALSVSMVVLFLFLLSGSWRMCCCSTGRVWSSGFRVQGSGTGVDGGACAVAEQTVQVGFRV